jgi:hypothetical protein
MEKQGKKINLVIFGFLIVFVACQHSKKNQSNTEPVKFDWLEGHWINDKDTSTLFFENWTKNSSENYTGISYILAHNDTVFFETIELNYTDTGTYYSVSVQNQNNANTVDFKLISTENYTYTFENKKHDFPQKIIYQYQSPDTLNAWIEGIVNGVKKRETFLMWRKK